MKLPNYSGLPHELKVWIGIFIADPNFEVRKAKITILQTYLQFLGTDWMDFA